MFFLNFILLSLSAVVCFGAQLDDASESYFYELQQTSLKNQVDLKKEANNIKFTDIISETSHSYQVGKEQLFFDKDTVAIRKNDRLVYGNKEIPLSLSNYIVGFQSHPRQDLFLTIEAETGKHFLSSTDQDDMQEAEWIDPCFNNNCSALLSGSFCLELRKNYLKITSLENKDKLFEFAFTTNKEAQAFLSGHIQFKKNYGIAGMIIDDPQTRKLSFYRIYFSQKEFGIKEMGVVDFPDFIKSDRKALAFHPSKPWVVISENGPAEYYVADFNTGKPIFNFKNPQDASCYWGLKMFITSHFLITTSNQRTITISDLFTGQMLKKLTLNWQKKVHDFVQSKNKIAFAEETTNENEAKIKILDLNAFEQWWENLGKWKTAFEKLDRLTLQIHPINFPTPATNISRQLEIIELPVTSKSL